MDTWFKSGLNKYFANLGIMNVLNYVLKNNNSNIIGRFLPLERKEGL